MKCIFLPFIPFFYTLSLFSHSLFAICYNKDVIVFLGGVMNLSLFLSRMLTHFFIQNKVIPADQEKAYEFCFDSVIGFVLFFFFYYLNNKKALFLLTLSCLVIAGNQYIELIQNGGTT